MKFDLNKEMQPWIDLLNNNFKWALAFLIRIVSIVSTIILLMFILKWTGLAKHFVSYFNPIKVDAEKPKQISKPSIPTHENDFKDIDAIKKMIGDKLKEANNDKSIK